MDLESGLFVPSSGKKMWYGSGVGFGKHHLRPRPSGEQDDDEEEGVDSKLAKTNSLYEGPHMLCFSSPNHQFSPVNSGYGYGGLSGCGNRGGGLFTPSQWMELEHQALIYKYLTANVPVPPYLLNPIRKAAFESAALSAYSGLLHRPNSFGWGGFQVGFSNPNDAEPGRCRRTDGKKWRCSRDAVADQKYCERHLNRGRHRSRKPVEGGQTGHSVSRTTNAAVARGGNLSGNAVSLECHNNNLKPFFATRPSPPPPSQRSLHQFIDDWPKNRPDAAEPNSDRTRLSISIPAADFKSSTSSPASGGNLAASPLTLAWEHQTTAATQMGLGVGSWNPMAAWEESSSVGGPLGEVFHSTSSRAAIDGGKDNDISALNLMEGWGDVSPRISSSPTGVLQTAALCSLSNSSAGSSPRAAVNGDGNCGPSLCSLHVL